VWLLHTLLVQELLLLLLLLKEQLVLVLVVSSVFFVVLNGYIHLDSGLTVKAAFHWAAEEISAE